MRFVLEASARAPVGVPHGRGDAQAAGQWLVEAGLLKRAGAVALADPGGIQNGGVLRRVLE